MSQIQTITNELETHMKELYDKHSNCKTSLKDDILDNNIAHWLAQTMISLFSLTCRLHEDSITSDEDEACTLVARRLVAEQEEELHFLIQKNRLREINNEDKLCPKSDTSVRGNK